MSRDNKENTPYLSWYDKAYNLFGIAAAAILMYTLYQITSKEESAFKHNSLPQSIRTYDTNKDGFIDYLEAANLEKALLQQKTQ